MSEWTAWKATVQEVTLLDPYDAVDNVYAEHHVLLSFGDQPAEVVVPMFEDLVLPLKGPSVEENVRTNFQRILNSLLMKLSKEHQFILVKTIIAHLVEDLQTSGINWEHLWYVMAACNPHIAHYPQKRQMRSLAKKLFLSHSTYTNHFIYDQLVALPASARLNRLERFQHFRGCNPKWLPENPAV